MTFCKLKNVRLCYTGRMFTPDEKNGKYSALVLVKRGSDEEKILQKVLVDAWAQGRSKFGESKFCTNPTAAQIYARAYIKKEGDLDRNGNPVPEFYKGFIGFNVSSQRSFPVIDRTGAPIEKGSPLVYSGCEAILTMDVVPSSGKGIDCLGRYFRAVMITGGGEPIDCGGAGVVDISKEFSGDLEAGGAFAPTATDFDAFAQVDEEIPF